MVEGISPMEANDRLQIFQVNWYYVKVLLTKLKYLSDAAIILVYPVIAEFCVFETSEHQSSD